MCFKFHYHPIDEEEVVPQKLKKSVKQAGTKTSKEEIHVKESPEKVKPTSALDFFGSSPVERASRKVFATKRKQRTDESENDEVHVPVSNTIEGEKGKSQTVNGKTEKQPSKKRKDDSGSVIDRKKASPQKSKMEDKLPTATPASKLAAKATAVPSSSNIKDTIPETPVGKTKEETSKNANSPTKDDKIIKKESSLKRSPKLSTDNDVPDQVPPSLEKKKSNYRSFMARDGPRALGTKPIPEQSVTPLKRAANFK
ncbi:replication factor C subunit 1-like [Montipora foliosa]|uniref:replication factor C subunit 1-like n=1 Tax=Montipora foliosa TaxID=591990 RepID=UPI0035F10EB5